MIISTVNNRFDTVCDKKDYIWDDLRALFKEPVRTSETYAEYKAADRNTQCQIKDVGGFIAGELIENKRAKNAVINRTLITLDLDLGETEVYEILNNYLKQYKALVYSTHKHTHEKPRLRIIVALKEPVEAEEYTAIARMVASEIGINYFDDTTYEVSRLMFFPSVSSDGEYYYKDYAGDCLDGKEYLKTKYKDWKDTSEWPLSDIQKQKGIQPFFKTGKGKNKDPREKPGLIGAWCKAYTIEDVIEKFLPDIYEPCGENRYTYKPAETAGGFVVFDHILAYSHHASDPANGISLNAFDLLRIHKFGHLDKIVPVGTKSQDLPSYKATLKYIKNDVNVKQIMLNEADIETDADSEWIKTELTVDKNGIADDIVNYKKIFEKDPNLFNIKFNGLLGGIVVTGPLPWNRKRSNGERWTDWDFASLRIYLASVYKLSNRNYIEDALYDVVEKRYFHPIKDYFVSLKWDGTPRLDELLITYLGAPDEPYTRAVTRKTFTAAAARVFEPGCKFDTMLVLIGEQGQGKSTLFAKMAGQEWFSDSLTMNDMRSKDAPEKLLGKLILEIAELAGMKKSEEEDVKAFLSRRVDSYRAAFGRTVQDHPRQCIIVGTTNSNDGFLRDVTGNRRFWPVKVDAKTAKKDVWSLSQDEIDQVWAEAVYWYRQKESLYLKGELNEVAKAKQKAEMATDDREGLIREYLNIKIPNNWDDKSIAERMVYCYQTPPRDRKGTVTRDVVSNMEIWCECFGRRKEDFTQSESRIITRLMSAIEDWERLPGRRFVTGGYGQLKVNHRRIKGPDELSENFENSENSENTSDAVNTEEITETPVTDSKELRETEDISNISLEDLDSFDGLL